MCIRDRYIVFAVPFRRLALTGATLELSIVGYPFVHLPNGMIGQLATVSGLPTARLSYPTAISTPTLPNPLPDLFDLASRFELEAYVLLTVLPQQLGRLKNWHVRGGESRSTPTPSFSF